MPLYPRNGRAAHLHSVLGHTNCRALLVSEVHAHEVQGLQDDLPDLEHVFVRDDGYESWLAQQSDVDPDIAVESGDYFIIRHTGGTTGPSKGVAYTHKAWLAAGRDWFYTFPPVEHWRQMFTPRTNFSWFWIPILAGLVGRLAVMSWWTTLRPTKLWR